MEIRGSGNHSLLYENELVPLRIKMYAVLPSRRFLTSGIPPKLLPALFIAYSQPVLNVGRTAGTGTGLGLSFVKVSIVINVSFSLNRLLLIVAVTLLCACNCDSISFLGLGSLLGRRRNGAQSGREGQQLPCTAPSLG